MERSLAVILTCLLGPGLALGFSVPTSTVPRPPRLIGCVFRVRSNVTCGWEPGDSPAKYFTLRVQITPSGVKPLSPNTSPMTFTCTTSGSSCTAGIRGSTLRIDFCITIISHGVKGNLSSLPRCQPGRIEAILPPVTLTIVTQVNSSPRCLNVSWSRASHLFPVSDSEIKNGHLSSQIEFSAKGEVNPQVRNATVNGLSFLLCLFRPDTSYTLRLRHRYLGPASPWSQWSNPAEGRTAEAAPSSAPVVWREVGHTSGNGWRLVFLLWKPLPHFLANGRVVLYSVNCQTENDQILTDYGSCSNLQHANTSCSLPLPAVRCSCGLKVSTSAGTSPEAQIWIPDSSEKEPPPPEKLTANPLGDKLIEVRWEPPLSRSISGFVVEWFAVREKTSSALYWEKLNSSSTMLVIAEGVKAMERYAVSVKALYGERRAGKNITLPVYTQEGTPLAGPSVELEHISDSSLELSWSPVPVEQLRGFIRNYTLFYITENLQQKPAKRITVPGNVHRYTLENMSPGIYDIYICASTIAGAGPNGNVVNVHIGSDEMSMVICVFVLLLLISLVLMLLALLTRMKMVKKMLFDGVRDPSNSSLSKWNPKSTLEIEKLVVEQEKPEVSCPEVIPIDKQEDLKWSHSYLYMRNHQIFHFLQPCAFPAEASDKSYITSTTKTRSVSDLYSRPCIYSNVQLNPNVTLPLLPSSYQFGQNSTNDNKQPAEGASEPPVLTLTQSDQQNSFRIFVEHLRSHQCSSDISGTSSVFPSRQTEDSKLNSLLTTSKNTPSHSLASKYSSFPSLVFMDTSSCPVEYGPYIPSDC